MIRIIKKIVCKIFRIKECKCKLPKKKKGKK